MKKKMKKKFDFWREKLWFLEKQFWFLEKNLIFGEKTLIFGEKSLEDWSFRNAVLERALSERRVTGIPSTDMTMFDNEIN